MLNLNRNGFHSTLAGALPLVSVAAAALLTGCVVAPVGPPPPRVVVAPAPVMVQPTYAMPAPGYVWVQHPRYGWGWHHPQYGWHQGWR